MSTNLVYLGGVLVLNHATGTTFISENRTDAQKRGYELEETQLKGRRAAQMAKTMHWICQRSRSSVRCPLSVFIPGTRILYDKRLCHLITILFQMGSTTIASVTRRSPDLMVWTCFFSIFSPGLAPVKSF